MLGLVMEYRVVTMRNFRLLQNTPLVVSGSGKYAALNQKFNRLKLH